ncbi:hypothetical protein LTR78_007335 [Recurvomyces mirabilis]|uniref:Uncharacterized protein n=1 Tax=Recurvomyces mirabilis TaxID=574656 RepID=A0AAE0TVG6_9PEZI|nr:hypothetical protein LTR78_007335 [Recurvomyces mirabilis]KAK5155078.1 hypothetical protein LTS14_006033 [Recurvomyces mirabilis]
MSDRFANYWGHLHDLDNRVAGPDSWSVVLRRTSQQNWEVVGAKAKDRSPSLWKPCSIDFHPYDRPGINRAWICLLNSEIQASAALGSVGAGNFVPLTREELKGLNFLSSIVDAG